ncbi:hypothetical protein Nepgr_015644 [Nepenthes gracilis]|uniref:Apple domain-containing protein n=1 Tax=Nepenthes gracilis TaxID=150966 RepID=A0AAD3SLF2_NEPGR|nr:hypothetical protein Nepgr_015644 [Nepenthes gracilis]
MARLEWGYQGRGKWCSYKRMTLIVCSINIAIALYVIRCLYTSLYLYSNNFPQHSVKYSPDQIEKMEESIRIRKTSEPTDLVKVVKEIKKELDSQERGVKLPRHVKQMMTDEILQWLRRLPANANTSEQRETLEKWRMEKLREAKLLTMGKNANLTISLDEAVMLAKAMESKWPVLLEEIGLWIPAEITSKEHDDKPEGVDEFEEDPLPGRPLPAECHTELHTDYDGAAVRWGLNHRKESAADCCQACLDQARRAKPGEKKCNIWVYCPSESGCYSPDIYEHKFQECWLKYAEKPRLNFKDKYSESYRSLHPTAPPVVPWVSGVVSI